MSITFRGRRGRPVVATLGSDLQPKTERGSIATHQLGGTTRAAAAARESGMATGAPIPEQAPPPGPYPNDGPYDDFVQAIAAALFPRSIVHGVVVDQDAPRSGHGQVGVTSDGDRRALAAHEFLDKIRELIEMDPGRFPRIRRANSRGESSRVGPKAEGTRGRHLRGLDAIGDAVQSAFAKAGRLPEGQALVQLLDEVEDHLSPDGETRAEARTRVAHRVQGLLRKL